MSNTATVSSKGQVKLPAAMRRQLGIEPGSKITFIAGKGELVIRPEPPIGAYYGMLKSFRITDTEIPKEKDRF